MEDGCGSRAKGLDACCQRGSDDFAEDGNESDDGDKPTDVIELTWHEGPATSNIWSTACTKLEEGVGDNEDEFGDGNDVGDRSGLGVLENEFEVCRARLRSDMGRLGTVGGEPVRSRGAFRMCGELG